MGGVGKSYLVDRFFLDNRDFFGGYQRLALDPVNPSSAKVLLEALANKLKLDDVDVCAAELRRQRILLHIENVDSDDAAGVAGALCDALPGCWLVLSARLRELGQERGWQRVDVAPFDETTALEHIQAEFQGREAPSLDEQRLLAFNLGGLPLALRLASGWLLKTGDSVAALLAQLERRGLPVFDFGADKTTLGNPSDPERERKVLDSSLRLSLDYFLCHAPDTAEWQTALGNLALMPAEGGDDSLAAAVAGLDEADYRDFVLQAAELSLLEHQAGRTRLHSLIARMLRPLSLSKGSLSKGSLSKGVEDETSNLWQRLTAWFSARLPEPQDDDYTPWHILNRETAALLWWLDNTAEFDTATLADIERAASLYAIQNGPYAAWQKFCHNLLQREDISDEQRSDALWTLCQTAHRAGDLDAALRHAEKKAALDKQREDEKETALAMGKIADILQARGELEEALRIRQEEEMPVYERLGDVRSRAVTMGKIADILQARGELEEALRIWQEEVLPSMERLGDVRGLLVTRANLAIGLMQLDPPRREEAEKLLCLALADAERMGIPEAAQIREILAGFGWDTSKNNS
jgi:tetratricopeptide (TPR) repeat protein